MTEHFSTYTPAGPDGSDPALGRRLDPGLVVGGAALPRSARALGLREDAFLRSVPTAELDLLLLHANSQSGSAMDAFQVLLRAMCASARRVERAGLQDGQISMDVDGIALAYGPDRLPDRRSGVFYRPQGAQRGAARLGYFLYRHQGCTRLRLAKGAAPDLLRDILTVVLRCTAPKAVVLLDSRIVLSLTELGLSDMSGLISVSTLAPGAVVPRPVARYTRPKATGTAVPSAFDTRRSATHKLSLDAMIAGKAALREQAHLRMALRPNPGRAQGRGQGLRRAVALAVLFGAAGLWVWNAGLLT